jgi:hypothetical protein
MRNNHSGKKVSKLTFIKYVKSDKRGNAMWLTKCDCGNTKVIAAHEILKGKTKSCGCVQTQNRSALGKKRWEIIKNLPRMANGYFPSINMSVEEQKITFDIDEALDLKPQKTKYSVERYGFKCPKCKENRKDFVTRYRINYYYCVCCGHEFMVNPELKIPSR